MVFLWVLGALLYAGGGGVVFGCPLVWIVVEGVEGDGVAGFPAVERYEGVEAVLSVPGRVGLGFGCCFQKGVLGAFPGVFPEKVFLCAQLVVVPLLLLPTLVSCVVLREVSLDGLVVLLGVHGGYGAGQCGVDVLWWRGAVGAWRRSWGRAALAGVPRSGLRWTRGIWSVVAWGYRAPAVPWVAGWLVGAQRGCQ